MFISRHTLKWTKTCRSSGDFPHAHTAHFLLNRHTDGLIRHSGHGTQYTGTVYTTRVMGYGMLPSTGTVGDSYDNAMAESADGAYRTELVWRRKPFADLKDLELATFRWVSWRGLEAPAPVPGLQDTRSGGNRVSCKPSGTSRLTIRAEQKSGHFMTWSVADSVRELCTLITIQKPFLG